MIITMKTTIRVMAVVTTVCLSQWVFAGAYLGSNEANPANINDGGNITHAPNYRGVGEELVVTFCINPDSESQEVAARAAQNVSIVWNELRATSPNVNRDDSSIPNGFFDFESVLLHELGHCIGLAHPNLASESDLTGTSQNYTQAQPGPNGVFDISPGPDNIIGSGDDIRGDDINRHWFRIDDNNPFSVGDVVDRRTYSVDLSDLPGSDRFAANADFNVGRQLGFIATEAIMQQGTRSREVQRTLAADDVAAIRLGTAGLDELQGTADDYTYRVDFIGVSNSCDIMLNVSGEDFGFCSPPLANFNSVNHSVIVTNNADLGTGPAEIQLGSDREFNWFFNPDSLADPIPVGTVDNPSGSWLSPGRDGEGWVIEKFNDNVAGFYWFTYPPEGADGQQLWLLGGGRIEGERYIFDDVQITRGAQFGSRFDPADVDRQTWGTLEFDFSDDDNGTVVYAGPTEFGSGSFDIVRFVQLDDDAQTQSLPPGISGSWFDSATDGEGWVIEVINANQAVIYWFTYDQNGNQAWNGGVADIVGNTLVLNNSVNANGTAFGTGFNSDDVQRNFFGILSFEFTSCSSGRLSFQTVLGTGTREIQRITSIQDFNCQAF